MLFFWIRLNTEIISNKWHKKYTKFVLPKFLSLEGKGLQYYCAFPEDEAEEIIDQLKSDKHELRHSMLEFKVHTKDHIECICEIEGDPSEYQVKMKYVMENNHMEEKLYLDKIN